MKRYLPFVIILGVLGVTVAAGYYLMRPRQASNASPNTPRASASPAATARVSSSANPGAEPPHAVGPAAAPVTLEEFGDFECPPCAMLHPVLKTMEKEFGPRLRVIFREFPLVPTHQHALEAARTAEAAGMQG
ncbi:MAG: DsbA family protein, partial [Pyrinomonadaceae bacterium]